jgi:hypothetical protein
MATYQDHIPNPTVQQPRGPSPQPQRSQSPLATDIPHTKPQQRSQFGSINIGAEEERLRSIDAQLQKLSLLSTNSLKKSRLSFPGNNSRSFVSSNGSFEEDVPDIPQQHHGHSRSVSHEEDRRCIQ